MGNSFCRILAFALAVVVSAQGAAGQSSPYTFSAEAVQSLPDIAQRANSPDLKDRIGVLDQVMTPIARDDFSNFRYAPDLSPEDYLAVVKRLLDERIQAPRPLVHSAVGGVR